MRAGGVTGGLVLGSWRMIVVGSGSGSGLAG